ncbi:MAG: creatininase family protein [Gemmatimonadales bacterium]|jgi:creatinine amidohydrolase/Fe(II)-dependent formamide hydrolase-like protein
MRTPSLLCAVLGLALAPVACQAPSPEDRSQPGNTLKLQELTYTDIDQMDRERSIFFLTFGNLEEHGPHLPVGSDYYQAVGVRDRLIGRLAEAHPEHAFVIVPVIPLGEGGANDLARQFEHVGTFAVRFETLRDVAIDLGAAIARQGFQNIFLVHCHGNPLHNVAFNEAAAFVSERYGVRMVNITSLVFGEGFYSDAVIGEHLGEGWQSEIGLTGHSGTAETSANLYLHDLVKPEYVDLEPFVVTDFAGFFRLHERTGWLGYWSDPSRATREIGEDLIDDLVERSYRIAEMALAGEDLSALPLYPDDLPAMPEAEEFLGIVQGRYAEQTAEVDDWLSTRAARSR